jgi:hypothetical protein
MMREVMPIWGKLREQHNMDPLEAGLVAVWCFFESQIGRENLNRSYSLYKELRDRLNQ